MASHSNSNQAGRDTSTQQQSADTVVESFLANCSPSLVAQHSASAFPRLHAPVVIPQQRPGNKDRGFIKAYAPDLGAFGIDQNSFLAFIEAINKAVKTSKWIHVIQVAAIGTGFIPNHIAIGVSAAVQVLAGVAAETEKRWKTNSFMDRINHDFFQPRGLYCLLMSYKPMATNIGSELDLSSTTAHQQSSPSGPSFLATVKGKLRNPAAGVSRGEESLPPSAAALIYPDCRDPTEQNMAKKLSSRFHNYLDRRARARYATESKGDILSSAPQEPFSNRYLDPNHPASNGGLLGLLSGGILTPTNGKRKEILRTAMAAQEQAVRDQQSAQIASLNTALQGLNLAPEHQRDYVKIYEDAHELQLQQVQQQWELLENGQRRITRGIVYLMIVNMPTSSDMETAPGPGQASTQNSSISGVTLRDTTISLE